MLAHILPRYLTLYLSIYSISSAIVFICTTLGFCFTRCSHSLFFDLCWIWSEPNQTLSLSFLLSLSSSLFFFLIQIHSHWRTTYFMFVYASSWLFLFIDEASNYHLTKNGELNEKFVAVSFDGWKLDRFSFDHHSFVFLNTWWIWNLFIWLTFTTFKTKERWQFLLSISNEICFVNAAK